VKLFWIRLRSELYWLRKGYRPFRCSKCQRLRWTEELIINHGWCDRCFDESYAAYMKEHAR
jgi:hypothetical protein